VGGKREPGRGSLRLVHDCDAVGRALADERPPASERCERALGPELTALLRRPASGDILSVPGRSTAVMPGESRSDERRMVSVGANEARAGRPEDAIEIACGCGDPGCAERIFLTPDELAFVRSVPGYSAVFPDHVTPDDHVIIGEPGRFAVVE
jgi:hypothetical protein